MTATPTQSRPEHVSETPVSATGTTTLSAHSRIVTLAHGDPQRLGYARVSTADQHVGLQMDALTQAGCGRIYVDDGLSGALTSRPALDRLLADARPGDVLVAWRLDRVGRSTRHLLDLVDGLEGRGIGFESITDGLVTTTATGRLMMTVLAALAAFERDLLRERTVAGLEAARSRGRVGGRPTVMTPERVEAARAMLGAGQTVAAVARALGVSRASVYRASERSSAQRSADLLVASAR